MSSNPAKIYDLLIIGGGPGGYVCALRAAQLGMTVGCIEKRKTLGGVCLNVGCIPSKALLDSSEHYHYAKTKFEKHGVMVSDVKLDLGRMMERKNLVVSQLTKGIEGLFKKNKIDWIQGTGRLQSVKGDLKTVDVDGAAGKTQIQAKKVVLATGSEPIDLPFLKFNGKNILSSTEALELNKVPEHLIVVGGGVIGLEMGSVWARLGAKVTVVEFDEKFLSIWDQQCSKEMLKILTKQGLNILLGHKSVGATEKNGKVQVQVEKRADSSKLEIEGDFVLVATGRKAYSTGLGLAECGVKVDERGKVVIDSHFDTSVPGVFAIGDLVQGPMLAHKAEEEGVVLAEHIAGQASHINYDLIPNVIYTWPEFAAVGWTEEQCVTKGLSIKKGVFPFLANGRAKAMDETDGFIKIIADAKTDKVYGVHIVGPRASDLLPEAVTVMEFGGSSEDIARTCHAHPTLSETMKEAALDVLGRKLHM